MTSLKSQTNFAGLTSCLLNKADIGGSLVIESLQDKSTYASRQSSSGGSISFGTSGGITGGSVNAGKTKIDSNFQSVDEQSGLRAGDGGFQVAVGNNTNLTGGVISSSQAAVDGKVNTFTTGGALTITDVQNTASYSGSGYNLTASISIKTDKAGNPIKDDRGNTLTSPSGSMGIGSDSGSAASTSSAGISGIAGNTGVRTGDASTGIKPIFDADKVNPRIEAEILITRTFGQQASKAIGDYAATQMGRATDLRIAAGKLPEGDAERARLTAEANTIEAKWGDNGYLRGAAHIAVGGLTGGANGALGAGVGTFAAPLVAGALADAGITGPLATLITAFGSTAASALAGGTNGAMGGFNEVVNNYLSHQERNNLRTRYDNCKYSTGSIGACQRQVIEEYAAKSVDNDKALLIACINAQSPQCKTAMTESIDYAADRRMDNYSMNSDRLRSGQVNFAQAYSLPDGQGVNYYTDRTARNNFYQAVQDVVTDKGSTVMWPQMAADVTANSRLGMHDFITCLGGIGTGTVMCGASKEINTAIFGDAFTQFSTGLLFGAPITGTAADRFDRNMVTREQVAAQPTWVRVQRELSGRPLGEWTLIGAGAAIPKLFPWQMRAMPGAFNNGTMFNQDARIQYGNQLVDQYRAPPAPNQTTQPNSIIKITP